jgi:hexosaminidase
MKKLFLSGIIMVLFCLSVSAQTKEKFFNLIPYPTELKTGAGVFKVNAKTVVVADDKNATVAGFLAEVLSSVSKTKIAVHIGTVAVTTPNSIVLVWSDDTLLGPQGYRMEVNPINIVIRANQSKGFFMATQTLRQLLPIEGKQVIIPALSIMDKPEFTWRGMMLDVCRHFFPKEVVKRYIDLISFYKINVLHWHLTDDQGWRIEIKKYPKLTEVGAWRTEADGSRYGGFYTQDEIRAIVAYAETRGVTIVPEIEMPGHSMAALSAYPELSCTGGPFTVPNGWGVFEDVYCAGKETTFRFMEDVLNEVVDLFPSKYIHIGGDECPRTRWSQCPDCQKRMKEEGLKNEAKLQSYFIHRIEKFLNSKGRSLTGWDEILEGGVTPNTTVQVWRDWKYAKEAAANGNDVIMSPTSHAYFDGSPEGLTLEKVYGFYPMPDDFPADLKKHILGGECALWTEHVLDRDRIDYLVFPRILAISEGMWNGKSRQPYSEFNLRVQKEYTRLQKMGVKYGPEGPVYTVTFSYDKASGEFVGKVNQLSKGFDYHYTLDGTDPVMSSPSVVNNEVRFKGPVQFKLQSFQNNFPKGPLTNRTFIVHQALGAEVTMINPLGKSYSGTGKNNLCDGMLGSSSFGDGYWQGIDYQDLVAVVDMGEAKTIHELDLSMLSSASSWILFPYGVFYEVSNDGKLFKGVGAVQNNLPLKSLGDLQKTFSLKLAEPLKTRYIKVTAKNPGLLPDWHIGKGNPCWIFFDELIVK